MSYPNRNVLVLTYQIRAQIADGKEGSELHLYRPEDLAKSEVETYRIGILNDHIEETSPILSPND